MSTSHIWLWWSVFAKGDITASMTDHYHETDFVSVLFCSREPCRRWSHGAFWAGSFMPMSMGPFSAKLCQTLESHKSSVQKRVFSSCPVVALFTPKTTRAQPWSVLLHMSFLFINVPSLMNPLFSERRSSSVSSAEWVTKLFCCRLQC